MKISISFLVLFVSLVLSGFKTKQRSETNLQGLRFSDSINWSLYKNKVVVINFWASWSKASRAENKNLARIYQKYKNNSKIVFISVSLDTEETNWKSAISEDEMVWENHICDFKKYNSPMVKKYNVSSIPKIIVFDKEGTMISSAITVKEIENPLAELAK
jgi:thiol-disulfide isomerase/thioredoxin